MPVLVGYDSSDEESEIIASKVNGNTAGSNSLASSHTPANGLNFGTSKSDDENSKPVLGPSIPSNIEHSDPGYEEDSDNSIPDLPEPDLLRYLTQPTHVTASIPPEPSGSADPVVTAKFKRFLQLKSKGVHFNEDLSNKSSFKNPSLFANLLERTGLPAESQYASTLPKDLFDPTSFPSWAYKEELLKSQRAYADELNTARRLQSNTGKRIIEFAPSSHNSTLSAQQKRKRPEA